MIKISELNKIMMVMALIVVLAIGAFYVYISTPNIESTQVADVLHHHS